MPIGLVPGQSWQAQTIPFKQKAKLILMSDGILEILPQDNIDDKQNYLAHFFAEHKNIDIKQALKLLIPESLQTIPDDITLLMVSK
jgi:serine phosphatase RsbU (regulator of sigma subunit)